MLAWAWVSQQPGPPSPAGDHHTALRARGPPRTSAGRVLGGPTEAQQQRDLRETCLSGLCRGWAPRKFHFLGNTLK